MTIVRFAASSATAAITAILLACSAGAADITFNPVARVFGGVGTTLTLNNSSSAAATALLLQQVVLGWFEETK